MKIGIFDSGMGGLSVLHQALTMLPGADFIYYADEAHVPYGEKTIEQIEGYIADVIDFMLKEQVDAIVIACNTATTVATKEYRARFPIPIIGMEPAVKKAIDLMHEEGCTNDRDRILVIATPVTIASDKLNHLLERYDSDKMVDKAALPGLVRFAERGEFSSDAVDAYLKETLKDYPLEAYSKVVLGCTHFNYFKEAIRNAISKDFAFVDGNEGTIRQLERKLTEMGYQLGDTKRESLQLSDESCVEYYFSGAPVTEKEQDRIEVYMRQLERVKEL